MTIDNSSQIPDRHQNFWQLACIQSASQSIPAMLIGAKIAKEYGAGTALTSICIGNLILWIIGLSMVSMTWRDRSNAIENAKTYLGKGASLLAALVLVIAFLSWYMFEIQTTTQALSGLFQEHGKWYESWNAKLGTALGLVTAVLAIGGIRVIRWICVVSFPILLFFVIYAIGTSDYPVIFKGTWGFSFSGIIASLAITLPGTINLPTFFRHSRSKADSFLALAILTIFYNLFQFFSVFVGVSDPTDFLVRYNMGYGLSGYVVLAILFIVLSFICLNLVNIYFASAGMETIIRHRRSAWEYAFIGILGTSAFLLLQNTPSMLFLVNIANNFIASFGIVMLAAFLIRIIVKHRPRPFERSINAFCWLVGCITSSIVQASTPPESHEALIAGVSASVVTVLVIVFIEETIWSIKKIKIREHLL